MKRLLSGNAERETEYLLLLHEEHKRDAPGSFLSNIIGYIMRRLTALTK